MYGERFPGSISLATNKLFKKHICRGTYLNAGSEGQVAHTQGGHTTHIRRGTSVRHCVNVCVVVGREI